MAPAAGGERGRQRSMLLARAVAPCPKQTTTTNNNTDGSRAMTGRIRRLLAAGLSVGLIGVAAAPAGATTTNVTFRAINSGCPGTLLPYQQGVARLGAIPTAGDFQTSLGVNAAPLTTYQVQLFYQDPVQPQVCRSIANLGYFTTSLLGSASFGQTLVTASNNFQGPTVIGTDFTLWLEAKPVNLAGVVPLTAPAVSGAFVSGAITCSTTDPGDPAAPWSDCPDY